jgi:hypothetical protein
VENASLIPRYFILYTPRKTPSGGGEEGVSREYPNRLSRVELITESRSARGFSREFSHGD